MAIVELHRLRSGGDTPRFGSNAVQHRFTQVGLECPGVPRFEVAEIAQDAVNGILDQVFGLKKIPRPDRQAAARPSSQRWQTACEQDIDRARVTLPGSLEQVGCGLER